MLEEVRQHRGTHAIASAVAAVAVALTLAVPRALPAFSGVNVPGAAPPKLLHIEGKLLREPPARGRYLSVGINGATRYLTVEQLRVPNSDEIDLAIFNQLKPRSPNLELRPLGGKQAIEVTDTDLLGKDVVLEGYVHLEDRSPMLVTKLEARPS
jgi:hypothetical protein